MLSTLLIIGCLVSNTIGAKRYDVEAEALKLYGEDIHDVIAKFRRSPDYLRILDSKVASLRTRMNDIIIQTSFFFDQKLKEKVGDLLGIKKSDFDKLESSTKPDDVKATKATDKDNTYLRKRNRRAAPVTLLPPLSNEVVRLAVPEIFSLGAQLYSLGRGKDWLESVAASNNLSDKFFRDSHVRFRRQEGSKEAETKATTKEETASQEQKRRVKILDSYHKLSSNLTLAQRNGMKELGFEFAGHIIHSLIRSMGGDDVEEKSTRHPFGGDTADSKTTSTTLHASVHEVTTLSTKPTEQLKSTQDGSMTSLGFMFK